MLNCASFLRGICNKILRRMVEIQRHVSVKMYETKSGMVRLKPPPRIPMLNKLIANTDHALDFKLVVDHIDKVPPVVRCLKCFESVSKPNLCRW